MGDAFLHIVHAHAMQLVLELRRILRAPLRLFEEEPLRLLILQSMSKITEPFLFCAQPSTNSFNVDSTF